MKSKSRSKSKCECKPIGLAGYALIVSLVLNLILLAALYKMKAKMKVPPPPQPSVLGQIKAEGNSGFDQFGYNYNARIFVGAADGVDRKLDNAVWGDPTYAKDHLVMRWSKGWDDARFHSADWSTSAWENNEWNGKVPGGSGETWHYKIIWVGPEGENSSYWREGGYLVWGQFEVIMSQGTMPGGHFWEILAKPAGYGGPYK